jgi:hypothetical protein
MFHCVVHFRAVNLDDRKQSKFRMTTIKAVGIENQAFSADSIHILGEFAGFVWVQRCMPAIPGDGIEDRTDGSLRMTEWRRLILRIVERKSGDV